VLFENSTCTSFGTKVSSPSCSVVICTCDRPKQLDQCLDAVSRLNYANFDVLIVDNAPSQEEAREVASRRGARYLLEPWPGLSRARNLGALACGSDVIAFLDDDSIPEPTWLEALAIEFNDPRVMAAAGRVIPLSVETDAERAGVSILGFDGFGQERRVVDRQTPFWFEIANFGGVGTGNNMAFRRQSFEQWRGFNEDLGKGSYLDGCPEEHNAFFNLVKQGHRVVYTPHAIVRHPCPRTWGELRKRYLKSMASATAYFTFLLVEEPRYRGATVKYVFEAMRGKLRAWRVTRGQSHPRIVPRWRALGACLAGPALYVRSRFSRGTRAPQA
jgi:O-antigen biosynthesis protein